MQNLIFGYITKFNIKKTPPSHSHINICTLRRKKKLIYIYVIFRELSVPPTNHRSVLTPREVKNRSRRKTITHFQSIQTYWIRILTGNPDPYWKSGSLMEIRIPKLSNHRSVLNPCKVKNITKRKPITHFNLFRLTESGSLMNEWIPKPFHHRSNFRTFITMTKNVCRRVKFISEEGCI